MSELTPFLFDNFIEDDNVPLLDLGINRPSEPPTADAAPVSTPEILDKIRNQLIGIIDDE
ncbi:MAG: hypothetical protein Q4D11_06085 [Rhodospirillales bacterium]|nr:hypothetical protein [Rhodospirillales bacterium]